MSDEPAHEEQIAAHEEQIAAHEEPIVALEELGQAQEAAGGDTELASMLRSIPLRVGAELGRARMPLGQAVDLGPGVVIELDRDADDPVELTINGQPFATGQLLLIDGNEWAIRVERVLDVVLPDGTARAAAAVEDAGRVDGQPGRAVP